MDDLDKLIAAVEAGEVGWNRLATIAEEAMPPREAALAATAYSGSLDAARRLHEALLPGWGVETFNLSGEVTLGRRRPIDRTYGDAMSSGLASRAWLIAILRAVKAQEARN